MYDELAHIERIYGSVAEYNRVKEEEAYSNYEPSQTELIEEEIQHKVYNKKIELLNGTPSELAQQIKEKIKNKRPKQAGEFWSSADHYNACQYDRKVKFLVLKELCDVYGATFSNDKNYFATAPGTFGFALEYEKDSRILTLSVKDLDYETFKKLYRDIQHIFTWVSVCYRDESNNSHLVSNTSLGGLRIADFKWWGLETVENLNKELTNLGFNEENYIEQLRKELHE